MVFSDEVQLLLFAPANLKVELLADVAPVSTLRAVDIAANRKDRLLCWLDSTLAILLVIRVKNLDVDLMAKDLSRNRILFVTVNVAILRIKLIAPCKSRNPLRRLDRLKFRNPLITLCLDFSTNLVAKLLAQIALHTVRPRRSGSCIAVEPLGLLGFANGFALGCEDCSLHLGFSFRLIDETNYIKNLEFC